MAKKDESYILKKMRGESGTEPWRTQYPSSAVSLRIEGDHDYAMKYQGDAKILLWSVKNRMRLGNLKSFEDLWKYGDGTTIRVQSLFGQDIVTISVGAGFPSCLIRILDLPEVVPPMKWYAPDLETFTKVDNTWVIKDPDGIVEVEGIDYIKTYYRLNVMNCNECAPLDFSVCETNELTSLTNCRPYTYDATKLLYMDEAVPYFQGFPLRIPPVLPDPQNHLIYSLYEFGQAEIIKFDSDNQGSYFLWKVYTEWGVYPPTDIIFSRTGLGYLLLKGFIQFEGKELCTSAKTIIKVDCCEKDISLRRIQQPDRPGYSGLWWESESGPFPQNCVDQPFMWYGTMKMCEVPSEISISDLFIMACIPVHPVAFYVLPDLYGSCLPYEWTLTGPGIWTSGGIHGEIGYYGCAAIDCHEEITISVKDRCGSTTTVHAKSCCESAGTLSIDYTSLLMSCNGQQTLTAAGGCGPYSWAISSGGGSLNASVGQEVVYTATATNVNCVNNPTITLTDCCGSSANIKLAVNCYTPSGAAITVGEYEVCGGCTPGGGITPNCIWSVQAHWTVTKYNCDGTVYSYCSTNPDCANWASINLNYYGRCPNPAAGLYSCPTASDLNYYLDPMGCNTGECPCGYPCTSCQCGQGGDCRTTGMKTQGCCPINPLTGLPY